MKLSFSTLGCPRWNIEEIIATAKDFGYQGIELRGVQNELHMTRHKALRPENIAKTRQKLDDLGLSIPCITSGCVISDAENISAVREELLQYVDVAKALNTPYVRVLGDAYAGPSKPVDDYLVETVAREIGEYANKKGISLLIETNGAYADTNRLRKLLDCINLGNVRALWDINHTYRYFQELPKDTLANLEGMVCHVHLKDSAIVNGRIVYRLMGQGDLMAKEAIELLIKGGYDGFFSLEWLKRFDVTLEEPGIAFMQYVDYMRKVI